jgi:dTDP-4-dehydrorhamnose reductase
VNGPILVVGAAGRLGAAIVEIFGDRPVVAHTHASLDITDGDAVRRAVANAAPSAVINCAAFNHVDAAEDRPSEAIAVNALAVRTLARAADESGATFVHYGTDFVFDGSATTPYTEESAPAPQSCYAQTKLLGEWFARDATRGFVLRVESLFGAPRGWSGRAGSFDQILDALEQGRRVKAFTDRVVSPSYVLDVARATRHLIESGATPGLYHCVNSGHATWFAIAETAARLLGVEPRIEASTMDAQGLVASRPKYCVLDNGKLAATGFHMPPWPDALTRWLAVRGAGGTIQ